jgi:hypothetical protein
VYVICALIETVQACVLDAHESGRGSFMRPFKQKKYALFPRSFLFGVQSFEERSKNRVWWPLCQALHSSINGPVKDCSWHRVREMPLRNSIQITHYSEGGAVDHAFVILLLLMCSSGQKVWKNCYWPFSHLTPWKKNTFRNDFQKILSCGAHDIHTAGWESGHLPVSCLPGRSTLWLTFGAERS